MIYGGTQFSEGSDTIANCTDAYTNPANCTTVAISKFRSYDVTAYYLFRLTFGNGLDEVIYSNIQ